MLGSTPWASSRELAAAQAVFSSPAITPADTRSSVARCAGVGDDGAGGLPQRGGVDDRPQRVRLGADVLQAAQRGGEGLQLAQLPLGGAVDDLHGARDLDVDLDARLVHQLEAAERSRRLRGRPASCDWPARAHAVAQRLEEARLVARALALQRLDQLEVVLALAAAPGRRVGRAAGPACRPACARSARSSATARPRRSAAGGGGRHARGRGVASSRLCRRRPRKRAALRQPSREQADAQADLHVHAHAAHAAHAAGHAAGRRTLPSAPRRPCTRS